MKKLFSFLGRRWFLSLLGTTAVALLVWLGGDLISIGGKAPLAAPSQRLIAITGLFGVWALWQVALVVRARLRNANMVEQLTQGQTAHADPTQAATADELAALDERFQDALRLLKGAEGRHRLGGRWIYQLPWYMIIGPPGCGKTTALVNSGLRFPLAARLGQGPVQGVGGTRNCDWWFTDDAVLLDTAGRYTTQDSYEQVDRSAWQGFLALLKKHRTRRPINGVIVAISLSDLLQQSPAERAAHVQAVKARLQELYTSFKVRFPVYLLLMKADLIAGFTEYFADLGKEGRAQVWGATFPLEDEAPVSGSATGLGPAERLRDELDALLERLSQRRLARIEDERAPQKRALIFAFPQQFSMLAEVLEEFVRGVFTPSRYEVKPLLRGFYFTSGTQTGTPIDRVLASISNSFGFASQGQLPFEGTGRGYFLQRLFTDLVFGEAGLAGLNQRLERRRRWVRNGAFVGLLGIALIVAGAWATSYSRNQAYIQAEDQALLELDAQLDALPPDTRDPLSLLPLLDSARALTGADLDPQGKPPFLSGLGLYQGNKLGPEAHRAYLRILRKALLPAVMLRLEDQIRAATGDPEFLHDVLRVYLMLDDAEHYDAAAVQYWVGRDWDRTLARTTDEAQREALKDHLHSLLEQRPVPLPLTLDEGLIARAREILNREPLQEQIYQRLKDRGLGSSFAAFTVGDSAGDYAKLVFERRSGRSLNDGIDPLYTYEGYHQGFNAAVRQLISEASNDSWILGPTAGLRLNAEASNRLTEEVRRLYLRDYVEQWNGLLEDIDIVPPRDLHHAAEIARTLADREQSPLRRLLLAVSTQTALDVRPDSSQAGAGRVPEDAPVSFLQRVDRYFDDQPGPSPAEQRDAPEAYVSRRFDWLHQLMGAADGQAPPFDRVLDALDQTALHLKSVGVAASSGRGVLAIGETAEIENLKQVAGEMPEPVSGVLTTLAQDSGNIISGGMRALLNRLWTAEVLPFCREAIHDRYPFERDSTRETTLHDFARLFGPGGLLDSFFSENLSPLVDTSGKTWKWLGNGIGSSAEVLAEFQRAAVIREAFFLSGNKMPLVEFELTPERLDANARQFLIDLGGQIVDYRHGPPKSQMLQWPSPIAPGRVRMVFVDLLDARPTRSFSGPWAWFRLLDDTEIIETNQSELFKLIISLAGHTADFELRAVSVRNPFKLQELRGFRCLDRI